MPRSAEQFTALPERRNFRRRLLRWFERQGRDLPWRRTRDPYAILVSEFMLQQTQVTTVLPYYRRWLERFPNFASLARASEEQVLHAWQGLGYYARARNLRAAATVVMQRFGGRLPADPLLVRQLPGVGRYSAAAISSFAFDLPEPVVDTNVGRVLARLTDFRTPIDSSIGRQYLWTMAAALLPEKGARQFNSALMELGALVCLPRRPRCGDCPVQVHCRAENPALLPRKQRQTKTVRTLEPHAFVRSAKGVLLQQSHERWSGMWILPRLDTTPRRAPLVRVDFPFTHYRITLAVFRVISAPSPNEDRKWFSVDALSNLPIATPHRRALAQLLSTGA